MFKKILAGAAAMALALATPAFATQQSLTIPTVSPLSGLQAVTDMNGALKTLADLNSGGSAPTTTSTGFTGLSGLLWHNTGNGVLSLRDQADTYWMPWAFIDETNKQINLYSNTRMYLDGAANTGRGIFFETVTVPRWFFGENSDAETGGNAGSSLCLNAQSDSAGAFLGTVLCVDRPSQVLHFQQIPTAPTASAGNNSTNVATTAFVLANTKITSARFTNENGSGSNSGDTVTNGSWTTRLLNTTGFNTISGLFLSGNTIGIGAAGTYLFHVTTNAHCPNDLTIKSRILNASTGATVASSTVNTVLAHGATTEGNNTFFGQVTTAGGEFFSIQTFLVAGGGASSCSGGFGIGSGINEVFTEVVVEKIA